MRNNKSQQEFELKFPVPATCEGFNGGFYFITDIWSGREKRHPHQQKWIVWQASRESLVIDLPQRHDQADNGVECFYCDELEEAIHAAGVKTK